MAAAAQSITAMEAASSPLSAVYSIASAEKMWATRSYKSKGFLKSFLNCKKNVLIADNNF